MYSYSKNGLAKIGEPKMTNSVEIQKAKKAAIAAYNKEFLETIEWMEGLLKNNKSSFFEPPLMVSFDKYKQLCWVYKKPNTDLDLESGRVYGPSYFLEGSVVSFKNAPESVRKKFVLPEINYKNCFYFKIGKKENKTTYSIFNDKIETYSKYLEYLKSKNNIKKFKDLDNSLCVTGVREALKAYLKDLNINYNLAENYNGNSFYFYIEGKCSIRVSDHTNISHDCLDGSTIMPDFFISTEEKNIGFTDMINFMESICEIKKRREDRRFFKRDRWQHDYLSGQERYVAV